MSDTSLLDLRPAEARKRLEEFMSSRSEPAYRVDQVMPRLWHDPVGRFEEITVLPLKLREALDTTFPLTRLDLVTQQLSTDGTRKFLFRLSDGQQIETVSIPDGEGRRLTLCISSQAGCALQCSFCATGAMGFARNLSASEIANQVRAMAFVDSPPRPSNIVCQLSRYCDTRLWHGGNRKSLSVYHQCLWPDRVNHRRQCYVQWPQSYFSR